MATRTPWVLNFDADLELEDRSYQRSRAVEARFEELKTRVGDLVREGPPGHGYAFCPTPSALRSLRALGATRVDAPAYDVLRRANHRAFCHALPDRLSGSEMCANIHDVEKVLAVGTSELGWFLRRPFGFAGRGRKRVARFIPDDVRAWLNASFARADTIEIVPIVERVTDLSLHGYLSQTGELTEGEITIQRCDAEGAWMDSRRANETDVDPAHATRLRETLDDVAIRLNAVGYFGPFGIDGFVWRAQSGSTRFHACSDINARYSMGYSVGMGDRRPELAADR